MTQDVTNAYQLQKAFGLDHKVIRKVLADAKLNPVMSSPFGKGIAHWFDKQIATAAVKSFILKEQEKIKPASKTPVIPAEGASLTEMRKTLALMDTTVSDIEVKLDKVLVAQEKLCEQNIVLLRKITEVCEKLTAYHKELAS